jgi:hypothetical protein
LKVATYDNFGNFYKLFYNIIIDAVLVKWSVAGQSWKPISQ